MKYRLGWPFGRAIARISGNTLIKIDVIKDDDAGVFVGTSRDLRGLVIEAATLEELEREACMAIPALLKIGRSHINAGTRYRFDGHLIHV